MTTYLLTYGLPAIVAIIAGVIAGCLAAAWKLRPHASCVEPEPVAPEDDPFADAEIDLAAVRWAEANDQPPQAARLMGERLKSLHKIGKGKGWFE